MLPVGRIDARTSYLWLCSLALPLWCGSTSAQSAVPLIPEQAHSPPAVAAGGKHRYRLDVEADRAYLIRVDQLGLDFIVRLEFPDGRVSSFNTPLFRDEREFVLLEGAPGGPVILTVFSEEYTGAHGSHRIVAEPLTDAVEPELVLAWRLMTRAAEDNFRGGDDGWQEAIDAYVKAEEIFRNSGRTRQRAQALFSLATIQYWQMYDWRLSSDLASKASSLYEELDEPSLAASAIHLQAAALMELANEADASDAPGLFKQALELLHAAAGTQRALGNRYSLAEITNNIGLTFFYRGNYQMASRYWNEAAAVFRELDEWAAETKPVGNLAVIDFDEGQLSRSIDSLERLISLLPEDRLHAERARHLDNLGNSNRLHGSLDEALKNYSEAHRIHLETEDKGETWSLLGLGQTYYSIGNLELATDYLGQALPVAEKANEVRAVESILKYRGNIEYLTGNYPAALDYHESALARSNSVTNQIHLQLLVANDLVAMERNSEARTFASEAKKSAEQAGSRLLLADSLQALGRLSVVAGEPQAGESLLGDALEFYESLILQSKSADTLNLLARAARNQGDLVSAVRYGEASLENIEGLRAALVNPESRAHFFATRRRYFDDQVGFLMGLQRESGSAAGEHVAAALSVAERSRARMMADLLNEASIDLHDGRPLDLQDGLKRLNDRLADMRYQKTQMLERTDVSAQELADLAAQMAATETELSLLEADLRRIDSRYSGLAAPKAHSAQSIQKMLDDGSILLQYQLGEDKSHVFVVSSDSLEGVTLAGRGEIDAAARRAFDALGRPQPTAADRRQLSDRLEELSRLVIDPVAELLTRPQIVIAADGALQYIPFGALPRGKDAGTAMASSYAIVNVQSMSVVSAQRARLSGTRAPKTLAVFADPVFQPDDGRFQQRQPPGGASAAPAPVTTLTRLPYTGREADAIVGLVPADDRSVFRGFQASKSNMLSLPMDQYRYVHIATHGLVDSRYPSLSSLALSFYDEQGRELDGLLRMREVFDLELNADLVVLSACETALGREIRGEGLLGLAQGFTYAGARSLVISLWQVPDRATSELIVRFYRYLIQEQLSAPVALRKAQLSLASERRWSSPYFWAGFQIFGDWR